MFQVMIVEAGALEAGVIQAEAKRLDQVEHDPRVGAQANHIAGVGRYLGLIEDDVEHCPAPARSKRSIPEV